MMHAEIIESVGDVQEFVVYALTAIAFLKAVAWVRGGFFAGNAPSANTQGSVSDAPAASLQACADGASSIPMPSRKNRVVQ